jgi:hypothetical protein
VHIDQLNGRDSMACIIAYLLLDHVDRCDVN